MALHVDDSCITSTNLEKINLDTPCNINSETFSIKWGLPLNEVYKLAVSFYKEKDGKAVQLSYEDKLQLVAFLQQVSHGPYSQVSDKLPAVGALDVVGKDRRMAWEKLGDLSSDDARCGFIELLSSRCEFLRLIIEAHRREKEERERKNLEEAQRIEKETCAKKVEEERLAFQQQLQIQIQQALNQQTYHQFRQYAAAQFPGDVERQSDLVKQLQHQHYLQYMRELQLKGTPVNQTHSSHTILSNTNDSCSLEDNNEMHNCESKPTEIDIEIEPLALENQQHLHQQQQEIIENEKRHEESEQETYEMVEAHMWTRTGVEAFKRDVAKAEGDGVVRVGHGETVTVRVPAVRAGRLVWEFATDYYDIGFGIYFEWGTPSTTQVSVHVSESEDDDDELDDDDDDDLDDDDPDLLHAKDLELGSKHRRNSSIIRKPLLTEIIPVYRRDCHMEVYAGCHTYPGSGVYLLKFDNSYSLWRSKTLYYRIYYARNE